MVAYNLFIWGWGTVIKDGYDDNFKRNKTCVFCTAALTNTKRLIYAKSWFTKTLNFQTFCLNLKFNFLWLDCQNPNSTKSSVHQSLGLDYILTCRFNLHRHHQHHKLSLLLLLLTAKLAGRDLSVQLYSHRPVQLLSTMIDSPNVTVFRGRTLIKDR